MRDADAVIVGGGIAGIVCALQLLDGGKRVLLLDRDTAENFGGLARESFGGILIVGSPEQRRHGIRDTPDLALQDWLAFGGFAPDGGDSAEHWPRRWAEAYVHDSLEHIHRWLGDRGVRFLPMPLWVERGLSGCGSGRGNSVPRWHVAWGTGLGLTDRLIARLQSHPARARLETRFAHRVEALLSEGGKVAGCRGVREDTGATFEVSADIVVIAAGGINGGDLSMVRRHWHPDWGTAPKTLLNGSHRHADGTLHRAAQEIGARLANLHCQWNYAAGIHHWRPRKPDHGLSLVPPKSALWLNWRGERIGPIPLVSGFDTRDLVTRICAQERAYSWQVMNRRIALKELAISGAEFNPAIRNESKIGVLRDLLRGNRWLVDELLTYSSDVVTATSLGELAEKMNALQGDDAVSADALHAAIAPYDAEIDRGPALHNDEQLRRIAHLRQWRGDRLRTCRFQKIVDPKAMPLIAIREFIISRKSLGGIQTNLDSQALDGAGTAIAGLYAVGEAAGFGGGGMNGLRGLEGTFLGGCIYSAQRAARHIAAGA
jgi:predicted oxidoreductase